MQHCNICHRPNAAYHVEEARLGEVKHFAWKKLGFLPVPGVEVHRQAFIFKDASCATCLARSLQAVREGEQIALRFWPLAAGILTDPVLAGDQRLFEMAGR